MHDMGNITWQCDSCIKCVSFLAKWLFQWRNKAQPKDRMTYLEQIDKGKKQFDPVESQCPKTNSFCVQRGCSIYNFNNTELCTCYNVFEKWNLWETETLLWWIKVENVPIINVMNTPNPWYFHQKGSSCHKQSGHRWGPAQILIGWKRGTFRECPRGCRCQTRSSNDAPVVAEWETFQLKTYKVAQK